MNSPGGEKQVMISPINDTLNQTGNQMLNSQQDDSRRISSKLSSKQRGNIDSFMKDISDADSSYQMFNRNPNMRFNFPLN